MWHIYVFSVIRTHQVKRNAPQARLFFCLTSAELSSWRLFQPYDRQSGIHIDRRDSDLGITCWRTSGG